MANGRARLAPQERPRKQDPLKRKLDTLLPPGYDSLDDMMERALSGRLGQAQVRPGQAYPSYPDPSAYASLPQQGIPVPPPVVEETQPPSLLSPDAPVFRPGTLEQVREQMGSPLTEAPEVSGTPPILGGVPPWMQIDHPPERPDTRNLYERKRPKYRPDGTVDPMPQDATWVRPPTPRDIIATLPPSDQIAAAEEYRQFEQALVEGPELQGPPTRGQSMGMLDRNIGVFATSIAGAWQGVLNVGELVAGQWGGMVPGAGRPGQVGGAPIEVDPDVLTGFLHDLSDRAEDFQEHMNPSDGSTGFFDVLEDPTRFVDWAVPATIQGLTTTGLILGAAVVSGGPAAFGMAFAMNYPEAVRELEDAGLPRDQALEWGAVLNVPVAFWDTMLPGMIKRQIAKGILTEEQGMRVLRAAQRDMRKHAVRRVAEAAAKGALVEAVTEGPLQEGTTIFGGELARLHTGKELRRFEEWTRRIIENAAAGALPGLLMGGGASAYQDVPRRKLEGVTLAKKGSRRQIMAEMYEQRAATGEFGEVGVEIGHEMREERIERDPTIVSAATEEAPAEGVVEPTEAVTERRVDEIGPPEGMEERRVSHTQNVEDNAEAEAKEHLGPDATPEQIDRLTSRLLNKEVAPAAEAAPTEGATIIPLDVEFDARVDVDDLQVMEGGQYKKYGKQAASKGLEGAKKWNDKLAGVIQVWKGPPGEEFAQPVVINGHNRYALAKRLRAEGQEIPPLRVTFIEGESLSDARATGALTNIAEGRGTVWDAAEFFREGGYTVEDLLNEGMTLDEEKIHRGLALSKLIPEIYKLAFAGQSNMTEEKGVLIGQADLSEVEQRGLLKHFRKRGTPSAAKLRNIIALGKGEAQREVAGDLWADTWIDESLLDEKADITTAVERSINKDKDLSRKLLSVAVAAREQDAAEVNELRSAEIGQEAAELERALEAATSLDPELQEILNIRAREIKAAKKGERNAIVKKAAAEALERLRAYSETAAPLGAERGEAATEGATPAGEAVPEPPAEPTVRETEAPYQEVAALPVSQGSNGKWYVHYPSGKLSMGFKEEKLARKHAVTSAKAMQPTVEKGVPPEPGEEFRVVKNPLYEGQGIIPASLGHAVLREKTGDIVAEGSFAEMMAKAEALRLGEAVLAAPAAAAEVIQADYVERVVDDFDDKKQVEAKIKRANGQLNKVEKKINDRKSVIRPQAIEGAEELERERQRLEAYISELHKVADKFLGAQRAAKGEASMQTIIEKVLPDGRIVYESAASPDFKREAARKIREEWAAIELERETKRRAGVAASRTVFSAPTPFLNRSVSLDQWLDLLEGLMPRTKPKRKHEKGKIKRSGAVINAENEEAINEFEYLFTHLAQNPLLIQTAHDNPGNSQIDRLFELMSHPWFGTETAPGAGNKPAGQKQVEVPNGKMDRFIDGKTVQIERSQRLTKDPDKRSTWYFVHPQHGRIEFGPNQHRSIVDEADQLTLAIRSILVETQQRQSDLNAVAHGRKLFEIDETALPPGQPDTEASVDLSPGGQEDMFGKGEEEPGDLYLTEPQYELNLTEDQTVAAIRRAHQTVANYYGLWKTGDATERQLSQLHTSMKIIASFQAENEESWGFKTEDIIALDAHFGNQRATGVKERRLDVETGELFDYYGLDPTGVPGVTGGGPRGFVDFIPTMSMPGAGQIGDDAELQKKYKAEMEEKGLAHLWKKGKIPSRRDAVRMIGRALMTPITTGRTKLGKSWGRFYSHFRSIRTKWAYDMEGVGHEVGHAIMHLIWEQEAYTKGGALSNRVLMSWDHELGQFGQDYAKWQGQEGEGVPRLEWFAEYIRRYISNRAETTKAAPELTKFMEAELLKREPGVQEALDFATFVWKHWRNQTPEARILSQFMFAKEVHDDRAWSWIMVPPLVRIKRAWWDLHVPFDTIVQTFNPGMSITDPRIPLDENPALLVRLMGGAAASGDESWMYGITDAETGMRTSEGPEKLILAALNYEGFASQQEGFALLTAYGAALRNIERAQVAIKRAEQWAERLNERHNEAGRFVVRESEVEPGAFDVFDLRTDKVIGRRFKQYILGMSYQDSLEVVKNAEAQGYKEIFDTTMEGLYAFSNARLDWLVQMGVLTQENAEVVKEGSRFYVPMVPVIEKLDQRKAEYQRAYPRHELSKVPGAPRRQKAPGSAAQKRNWIDQLYIDTQYLTLLGMRQRTIQSLYNMTKRHRGTGVFLEAIAKPVTATPVELRQMIDRMGEFVDSEMLDYMKDNIDSETMNEMLMVFAPGDYMNNIDTVRVRDPETNEIKWLQVNDPELLGALLGIESQSSPALKAVTMTWVAKSLRLGATLSPGFSLYRNPGRDSIQAWIMSEWGIKIGYDHVRAMYHMIGKDELYQKFLQSGAAFSSLLDFDQRGIARKVQKAQRSKIVNVVGDAVEALKILGTWTENMNRFAEYERAYETLVGQGVGEMEARTRAAYAARDVTVDFWRHGYQTAAIRQMVAFWNANLQGWSKMSRTARENPGRFAWRTFQGITVPSMLLWLVNHDDDEYKALPNWLKDFYWLIPLDPGMVVGGMMGALTGNPAGVAAGAVAGHTLWDKLFLDELEGDDPGEQRTDPRDIISPVISRGGKAWLKFPKPFFMGQAFGTLAERGLDWAHGEDPEFADRLKEMFWDEVIAITPLPTGWRGILQLIPPRGYDMFRQRPLMGQEMAERDSWTQYTPGTSRGARWLGKAAADVGFRGGQGLSPVKIDNLMYSYFGTLMRDAVKLSDLGIRISGQVAAGVGAVDEPWGTDVAAGRSPAQLLPLIGDLIQVWPYGASSHVDRIHKLWDEADRKYRTHGHLFKEDIQLRRDGAGARAYLDANPGVFGEYAEVAAAYALLRVLDYRISAIQHDPDLSDKEKLLGMADLWNEKDITARSALERFEGGNK